MRGPDCYECVLTHRAGLAYRAVGHAYRDRLGTAVRLPGKEAARLLGLQDLVPDRRRLTRSHLARLVMGMVRRFCYTSDQQLMARHMERVNGLAGQVQERPARLSLPYARQAWGDLQSPRGRLRFEHDHYLKLWALTGPVLEADFVMQDEAQGTNAVVEGVFLAQQAQQAQRVCVGDPAQQIHAWRQARDVMTGFPAEHRHLTQSFRLGPPIAAMANRWLRHAGSSMQLTGHGPAPRIAAGGGGRGAVPGQRRCDGGGTHRPVA